MKRERVQLVVEVPPTFRAADIPMSLDQLVDFSRSKTRPANTVLSGIVIGELVGFGDSHSPLIDFKGNTERLPLTARSTVSLNASNIGKQLVLQFENGDIRKPIVLGLLHAFGPSAAPARGSEGSQVQVDDEHLIITAEREITLLCGKASITLTRAGKILIRGEYVLSRASGANHIQGSSVQLN